MTNITIQIRSDKKTSEIISDYLQLNNIFYLCNINIYEDSGALIISCNNQQNKYEFPVRIGKIIDQFNIYKNIANEDKVLNLANGTLDINQSLFARNDNKQIYLTEKETAIIRYLYESKGKIISRDELLKSVWEYVDNVETHTLETHIYRLRQKIEDNPSEPKIIITDGDGYKISDLIFE